jgi:hypothetical protein
MKTLQALFGVIVPTFFTTDKSGVSISEVSRIQAENKQQNDKFWSEVSDGVSGVFQKEVSFVGAGDSTPRTLSGSTLSVEHFKGYSGVAERNAQTANLMHAVKLFKRLQGELESMNWQSLVGSELPPAPERPAPAASGTTCYTEEFMDMSNIDEMLASLTQPVMAKFDLAFWKRANELNSRAATLGKLLSEQGSFFRELVKPLPKGGETPTQNGVIITSWKKGYSETQLSEFSLLRDELQSEYNDLQKQLNSCKKQIKDAVREYNLDAERQYQAAYGTYKVAAEQYNLEVESLRSAAETRRQEALQEFAALRVKVQ